MSTRNQRKRRAKRKEQQSQPAQPQADRRGLLINVEGADYDSPITSLAKMFDQQVARCAAEQMEQRPEHSRIPFGVVKQTVPQTVTKINDAHDAQVKRSQAAGYDSAVGKYFETAHQAAEYRKANGINYTQMSKREFEQEVGGPPSSGPSQHVVQAQKKVSSRMRAITEDQYSKSGGLSNVMWEGNPAAAKRSAEQIRHEVQVQRFSSRTGGTPLE